MRIAIVTAWLLTLIGCGRKADPPGTYRIYNDTPEKDPPVLVRDQ